METSATPPLSEPRLLALGDAACTVEFGATIDPALHARVLGLAQAIAVARSTATSAVPGSAPWSEPWSAIVDVVPTFRSLTVYFDPLQTDGERLGADLLRLAQSAGSAGQAGRQWRLPVCFDDEYAPDLEALASAKGLTREAVVALMCEATFQVYMIGFMPGFPYMGGLPKVLEVPRLASPRKAVPARSLAVAGAMCAVYPWQSPGGWHLLGRTPLPMFSAADSQSPSLLASGDRVRWQAVDKPRYLDLEAAALAGAIDRGEFLSPQGDL